MIMTAAQTLAPLLLAEKDEDETDPVAVKVNYLQSLNEAYTALTKL